MRGSVTYPDERPIKYAAFTNWVRWKDEKTTKQNGGGSSESRNPLDGTFGGTTGGQSAPPVRKKKKKKKRTREQTCILFYSGPLRKDESPAANATYGGAGRVPTLARFGGKGGGEECWRQKNDPAYAPMRPLRRHQGDNTDEEDQKEENYIPVLGVSTGRERNEIKGSKL